MPSRDGIDPVWAARLEQRALALWPRLDRRKVRRCGGDVACLARVISHRTTLPAESVRRILLLPVVSDDDGQLWFG